MKSTCKASKDQAPFPTILRLFTRIRCTCMEEAQASIPTQPYMVGIAPPPSGNWSGLKPPTMIPPTCHLALTSTPQWFIKTPCTCLEALSMVIGSTKFLSLTLKTVSGKPFAWVIMNPNLQRGLVTHQSLSKKTLAKLTCTSLAVRITKTISWMICGDLISTRKSGKPWLLKSLRPSNSQLAVVVIQLLFITVI